jgi:hypothetical protein
MEISVLNTPETLEIKDFENLKAELTEKVSVYAKIVYTDETIKDAKKDRATLNKLAKAIADKRKIEKDSILERFRKFESECKELETLVTKASGNIDAQVKEYEQGVKERKRAEIIKIWESFNIKEIELDLIFNDKWLNVTTSLEMVKKEIESLINGYKANLEALKTLPFAFEAQEYYKKTLNLAEAIQRSKEMEEIQRKKEEKERLEREKWLNDLKNKEQAPAADKSEIEGQEVINLTPAQEEIKEEAAAPEAAAPEEITTWVSFSALLSIKTAKLLKEFLDNNNIEFKRI